MAKDWLEVSTTIDSEQAELAEQALLEAGAISLTLQDAADEPVLEPAPGELRLWPKLIITGLFDGGMDALAVLARVHGRVAGAQWRIASLAERAWEREWLRDFRPLRFGRRLAVVPGGMTPPPDTVVLRLDPGLAFGTGTHPTTALCLEWLDGLADPTDDGKPPLAGTLVVDYGCGSGILAIAALLLGAAEVVAVDLDPQALVATRANAQVNGVEDCITSCAPDALPAVLAGRKADILVANILAGPLQHLLPEFAAILAQDGRLALSGILVGQDAALAATADPLFRLDAPATREDWVRLSGRRKATS